MDRYSFFLGVANLCRLLLLLAAQGVIATGGVVVSSASSTPTSLDCEEGFFEQPLDHFSADGGTGTFMQRFFYNASFYRLGGPILYYTGNEADVTLYVNATGLMWEHAEILGALLVFGEHRYYGESFPYGRSSKWSPDQLQWLSVEQSLADHAALVTHIKTELYPFAAPSPVVAIGGSYGGMQAAWIRMTYPNVFVGAIAASAPILAFDGAEKEASKRTGNQSYWSLVTFSDSEEHNDDDDDDGKQCVRNVRSAWPAIDAMAARGKRGLETLQKLLGMCDVPHRDDVEGIKNFLRMAFDNMAMGNFPYPSSYMTSGQATLPAFPMREACKRISGHYEGGNALIAALGRAAAVFYNATLDVPCLDPPSADFYEDGVWDYLWCTATQPQETYFGMDGVTDMFWPYAYNETRIDEHCRTKYGTTPRYRQIFEKFGGMEGVRRSSNIVFSNGRFDPWRSGGVTDYNNTSRSIYSIFIENGAHHVDLMFTNPEHDTPDITLARQFEVARIQEWCRNTQAVPKKKWQAIPL